MRIAARFQGPPGSANGGVTAGRLAAYVSAPVCEVTLRRPPPLDTDLRVDASGGSARLLHGEALVAEATPATVDVDAPPPVPHDVAVESATRFGGLTVHPFPGCFVCGSDRPAPDGLGLRPGMVGPDTAAAAWTPESADPVMVWAALDCPGGWSADLPGRPMVLGRMALRQDGPPLVGQPHVVVGRVLSAEGRKTHTVTALYDADDRLLALARSTWLTIDVEQVGRPS